MRIYLIRHGQSEGNLDYAANAGLISENKVPDPKLTEKGHKQARLLGEHMAHPEGELIHPPWLNEDDRQPSSYGITHVYCSLMLRAVQTASYIADACNAPLTAHMDIFELEGIYNYNDKGEKIGLPGADKAFFEQNYPQLKLPAEMNPDGWYNRPFETYDMFFERTKTIFPAFEDMHGGTDDCIAIVSHGDTIDQLINELSGAPRREENYSNHWVANWAFHNTSVTRIDYVEGARTVVYTNQIRHLPPGLVSW